MTQRNRQLFFIWPRHVARKLDIFQFGYELFLLFQSNILISCYSLRTLSKYYSTSAFVSFSSVSNCCLVQATLVSSPTAGISDCLEGVTPSLQDVKYLPKDNLFILFLRNAYRVFTAKVLNFISKFFFI